MTNDFPFEIFRVKNSCFTSTQLWLSDIVKSSFWFILRVTAQVCQILRHMCHSEWPPYYCSTFQWQVILLSLIVPSKTPVVYTYGSVILWNLNFGSFCEWRHKFARSWSMCHSEWPPYYIVPHLNDKCFFFHKLYHPKLLWFIHMVQWYGGILILVHFASDGTCQILKPMCHSEWPPYYCSTFKWQVILLS